MRTASLLRMLLFLLCFSSAWPAGAQYQYARQGLAFRILALDYHWPALQEGFDRNRVTPGLELEYSRHLNAWLNFSLPLKVARASFPQDGSGRRFRTGSLASLDLVFQLKLFRETDFFYPYLFAGGGLVADDFDQFHAALPVGAGLQLRLRRHLYLSGKGEYRIGARSLRDNIQAGAGLLFLLGPGTPPEPVADRDGDGIPDGQDLCPDDKGPYDLMGCPDSDGDGIVDRDDDCPLEAGGLALNGCPDHDGDGITDKLDKCPELPGPEENQGCPLVDTDKDNVPDHLDECPDEPGPALLNGCPDRDGDGVPDKYDPCPLVAGSPGANGCPDTDGDGIADGMDRCPSLAGPAETGGCPEITLEEKQVLEFAAYGVEFETGTARLLPRSYAVLDQIVQIMRRYPDYHLRISGHTDSLGDAKANQLLSEQRAQASYDYLITRGISPERMEVLGFGESRPIADNRFKEGRDKNRRITFELFVEE